MSYLHHVPPLVPWLDHVCHSSSQTVSRAPPVPRLHHVLLSSAAPWLHHELPSSSQIASRAPLQLPGCITSSPPAPVPRLYHVLRSSSLAVSRAPLQFPDCIKCYAPVTKLYHVPPPPPIFPLATLG